MGRNSLRRILSTMLILPLLMFMGFACGDGKSSQDTTTDKPQAQNQTVVKYPGYKIINEYPHDSTLFTQGLFISEGMMYESGGMRGQSRLVRYVPGQPIAQIHQMPNYIFSEGICEVGDKIYMITYTAGKCFVFNKKTFELEQEFNYFGEGWGIEYHNGKIYMTDGSSVIKVINPETFVLEGTINVTMNGNKVEYLNELEFADGYLYANLWRRADIVKIDIETGKIVAAYNMAELYERVSYNPAIDVLNGIAYHETEKVFYLTGKLWPKLFKVKLGE